MDKAHYEEMVKNVDRLEQTGTFVDKTVFLFGHCNATEALADLLLERGYLITAILDNNAAKQGKSYRDIVITSPDIVMQADSGCAVVCIAARAYSSMEKQLRLMGFIGQIEKLAEYNSYAEYSLSEETLERKLQRVERGLAYRRKLAELYPGCFMVLCPFAALGDVFLAMSYLPVFLKKRCVDRCIVCVIGKACAEVAALFGQYPIETLAQNEMDELVQACLYSRDGNSFIAHQDRPYVVNLHRALYVKPILLERIYKCGIYGLSQDVCPVRPQAERQREYSQLQHIQKGRAVIFAPYAKSVPVLSLDFWMELVQVYIGKGYQCFTNVVDSEKPLEGTEGISPEICEVQSVVEHAGTFIGIRSGLCDVLKYAACRKIALYPDYHYSDTKWKAIDVYALEGWENLVVKDGFVWGKD